MKNTVVMGIACFLFLACGPGQKEQKSGTGVTAQSTMKEVIRNRKPDGTPYSNAELDILTHDELMLLMYQPPRDTISTIGILLYDGYFSLDALGPHAVLSSMYPAKTFFIAAQKGLVKSNNGLLTQVDTTMAQVTHLDILLVPGGADATYRATQDKALLDWVRTIDQNSKYTTSVCTGSWILGAAGLLKNKEATTNWYRAKEKLEGFGATFVNKRYTHAGKYWTSAGVSAGIDMSLALVDHIMGRNYADFIMLNLEYAPEPPFDGGSPEKTDPVVKYMTEKMYDLTLDPLIREYEQ
ncbi:MAG: DJ-1/PfpI family protein [Bacteroidota bacterium]